MTTDNTSFLSTEQSCQHPAKQEPAKHWFTRHFSKSTSRKDPDSGDIVKMIKQNSVPRPRTSPSSDRPYTAPSSGPNTKDGSVRPLPRFPEQFQCLSVRQEINAPRSPQADPGIVLNVDAWLDASKPSSPLMGGLSYWREGNPADIKEATNMQYAIPIIREPECERPSTSHSQQLKSFCRRAKNQVRLPSIGRIKSSQAMDENTRSESSPVLAISYEQTQAGEAPVFSTRMGTPPTPRPSTCTGAGQMSRNLPAGVSADDRLFVHYTDLALSRDSPSSIQLLEMECEMERLVLGEGPLTSSTLRPGALSGTHLPREDSMGSFGSSAPTYFSGMPPPSYKSRPASPRPASMLTTSSFGCIDGMNPEYRQLSQKKAADKQRSMKGRLRKLAKKANFRK